MSFLASRGCPHSGACGPSTFKAREGQSFSHCITLPPATTFKGHSPYLKVSWLATYLQLNSPLLGNVLKGPGIRTNRGHGEEVQGRGILPTTALYCLAQVWGCVRKAFPFLVNRYSPEISTLVGFLIYPFFYVRISAQYREHSDFSEADTWMVGVKDACGVSKACRVLRVFVNLCTNMDPFD